MKKFYLLPLLAILLFGCTIQPWEPAEKSTKETTDISQEGEISEVGVMDEELDVSSLETLEEGLEYIENI